MPKSPKLKQSEFAAAYALPDWRIARQAIHGWFMGSNFASAIRFVERVGAAADAADHHPDIDIRYPGRVRIRLTTHASRGLTAEDASLAATISTLAVECSMTAQPSEISIFELAIDARDIDAVRPFWSALLGYKDVAPLNPGNVIEDIGDPYRIRPPIWFQQMDAPRPQRNRIHVDVSVPPDIAQLRIDAAIAAGGRLIDSSHARAFWVLADPEGNEACVCTWQDRD